MYENCKILKFQKRTCMCWSTQFWAVRVYYPKWVPSSVFCPFRLWAHLLLLLIPQSRSPKGFVPFLRATQMQMRRAQLSVKIVNFLRAMRRVPSHIRAAVRAKPGFVLVRILIFWECEISPGCLRVSSFFVCGYHRVVHQLLRRRFFRKDQTSVLNFTH